MSVAFIYAVAPIDTVLVVLRVVSRTAIQLCAMVVLMIENEYSKLPKLLWFLEKRRSTMTRKGKRTELRSWITSTRQILELREL